MEFDVNKIIEICNANVAFGNTEIKCEEFSKDTRTIQPGDVYIGIKGENFDGNMFYENALENGAAVCILQGDITISEEVKEKYKDRCVVIVEDTIKALQQIAAYKRSLYNIPVIAITGSVGKTSTKDIVASVVGTEFNVLKTQGNLNNHIGLPMTILGLKNHNALVVEMGMNNLGEISVLSKIAKPNIAIITNVGTAHIGNLGSRENILKAKLEILDGMDENGILIINNDNDLLHKWAEEYNGPITVFTYGIEEKSNVNALNIQLFENKSECTVIEDVSKAQTVFGTKNTEKNQEEIIIPIGGNHFVLNALCSVAVGKILNISFENIKKGIYNFSLSKNRMELLTTSNNITIINDSYNANYDSMKAGIEYLAKTSANRKIAVLGDMLELGEFSEELHTKVGEVVAENKIDILVTVGKMAQYIANVAKQGNVEVHECENNQQAIELLKSIIIKNDIIYLKASNGMRFKEIVDGLM